MSACVRFVISLAATAALIACTAPALPAPSTRATLAREMPDEVGQCVESTITTISGRLEGDPSFQTGMAVGFANGGYQVSYDQVKPIIGSRIGDPVRMCLVRVPQGCPPGDDRGKVYATTNLRTGGDWRLADSSHRCGGV